MRETIFVEWWELHIKSLSKRKKEILYTPCVSISLPAFCLKPAATCCCVCKKMVVYKYLPEWLCALRAFGKCSHVWKLMAEELMGVLIAFQLGSQQPCKLDVFSSSIYHPRGVHCQAGEVWTTHHISLIQFKPVADTVEAHSIWHSIYRHTGEIFLEKEADIFLLF